MGFSLAAAERGREMASFKRVTVQEEKGLEVKEESCSYLLFPAQVTQRWLRDHGGWIVPQNEVDDAEN